MIEEIYIREAQRIRKEYLEALINITNEEDSIKKLTDELKEFSEEIENSESKNEQYYKDALIEIDRMITSAMNKIKPYQEKTKELDKQQRILYNNIKEKYPSISDDDIKNSIIPYIIEIDNKYKKKYGNIIN